MASNEDPSRFTSPTPPHAKPHDVIPAGLPPVSNQPTESKSDSEDAPTAPANDGGSNQAARNTGLLLGYGFIFLLFAGPIFGTLYPIPSGCAVIAGLLTNRVLETIAPHFDAADRLPGSLLAGAIVFWILSRIDHRLAERIPSYRTIRHVLRVAAIGTFFSIVVLNDRGGRWLPTSLAEAEAVLLNPSHLVAMIVGAVGAHFLLTKAKGFREIFHQILELAWLRPRNIVS